MRVAAWTGSFLNLSELEMHLETHLLGLPNLVTLKIKRDLSTSSKRQFLSCSTVLDFFALIVKVAKFGNPHSESEISKERYPSPYAYLRTEFSTRIAYFFVSSLIRPFASLAN